MAFARDGSQEVLWKVGNKNFRDLFLGVNDEKLHPTDNYREVISINLNLHLADFEKWRLGLAKYFLSQSSKARQEEETCCRACIVSTHNSLTS